MKEMVEGHSARFGWSVVALGFFTDALAKGGKACFAPMILVFETELGATRSQLSLLAALVHVFISVMTPISGLLIDRYPPHYVIGGGLSVLSLSLFLTSFVTEYWQVVLTYGFLCGSAFGSLNLNVYSSVVIKTIPEKSQGLAIGICNAGSTFGQFALTPLFVLFIRAYGWRLAYILLAAMATLTIIPTVWLLSTVTTGKSLPAGSEDPANKEEETADLPMGEGDAPQPLSIQSPQQDSNIDIATIEVGDVDIKAEGTGGDKNDVSKAKEPSPLNVTFKDKVCKLVSSYRFVAIGTAFFICGITTTGFLETHLIALVVEDGGMSSLIAALSFSVLSACNGAGMVISGHLTDRISKEYLLSGIFLIRAMTYIMLLFTFPNPGGLTSLFVFAAVFGFVDYSVIPPTVALVNSYVPEMVGFAVGILLMCHSAGAAVGAAAGGWVFESASNYDYALLGCAILCILAGFSCISAKEKERPDSVSEPQP